MSTRFVSPNGCFAATGMSICFRRPTTTLTLLSLFTAQRAKKRGDPAPEEETPGKGSARPAEPGNPPSGKGKRPTRLKAKARASIQDLMKSQKALVDGSMDLERANLRKAKRATPRRASPRKVLRKAPPRRASPRASTTARARARSEAA